MSYSTTLSAVAKLMPIPPAVVDMRYTNDLVLTSLKDRTLSSLSTRCVEPSKRKNTSFIEPNLINNRNDNNTNDGNN